MIYKAIPEQKPMAKQFATAQDALRYRESNGGWVFLPDDNGAFWFNADSFTASQVFAHPLTRRRNGRLL